MNAIVRAGMRDRLIVGLDVPSVTEAEKVVAEGIFHCSNCPNEKIICVPR